nr:translation initiation factor IF-2 isoform X2 [Oryctolagus cuniculus]
MPRGLKDKPCAQPRFGQKRRSPCPRHCTSRRLPAVPPRPPGPRERLDSRPSAAPAGPSSCRLGARGWERVPGERAPGERPEVAAGRARARELGAQAEAGGGRSRAGASHTTEGSAAPPLQPPRRPRAPNPPPGRAPARSAHPQPARPLPGPRPALLLKGPAPGRARSTSPNSRHPKGRRSRGTGAGRSLRLLEDEQRRRFGLRPPFLLGFAVGALGRLTARRGDSSPPPRNKRIRR